MNSLADMPCCEVAVIDPETGREIPISVERVSFEVACDNEPARATLRVFPDQVDVEALAAITFEDPKKMSDAK